MSVYRQGPRTFTEIYFSMHHGTILCGNVYMYICIVYVCTCKSTTREEEGGIVGERIESFEARVLEVKEGQAQGVFV